MSSVKLKTLRSWGRGSIFPHYWAWMLDSPGRGLILSANTVASRLPIEPQHRVLEVGAGTGYYGAAVAPRLTKGHLELFDIQEQMLEKCRAKMSALGHRNVGYTCGNAGELPFADNEFDIVYLVTVFGEIEQKGQFLKMAHRVLKPGGILSISEHHPDPDWEPADSIISKTEAAGFVCVQNLGWRWSFTLNFKRVG